MIHNTSGNNSRILLHSQRGLFDKFHYRLGLYEFEDIVRQVDSVDLITPQPNRWFTYGSRIANRMASDCDALANPGIAKIKVEKSYDLFFAVVQFPKDLLHIKYVEGWKERCRTSICWLNEIWVPDIAKTKAYLKILSQFDYVILHWSGSVKPVQEVIKKPCFYLPYGIDAIQFCPYPNPPRRVIDVYSIGRRSEKTHHSLIRMAKENGTFYVYDTIDGNQVLRPNEHRLLLASMAKRSRYFIVNPGKADLGEETGGQIEFGNRFFEGAASGAIMIGETPKNAQFQNVFNWKDAVIHLPFDSESIEATMNELDRDPQRQEAIRKNSIVQSLLRHDWIYRWENILKISGIEPMSKLLERKQRLASLARIVEKEPTVF